MKVHIIVKLILGIIVGSLVGLYAPLGIIRTFSTVGFIMGEFIKFTIPLLVIAFMAKGISGFGGGKVGRGLGLGLLLAYTSTILSASLGFFVIKSVLPYLNLVAGSLAEAKEIVPYLTVEIPAIMPILSALVLAIILGVGVTWIGKGAFSQLVDDFHDIVYRFVRTAVIPLFPVFVGTIFMELTAKGQIMATGKAFLNVLLLMIPVQWAWLAILYLVAGAYTKQNPIPVIKTMLPAYFTAMGTMSSAATLPVALDCARKVPSLKKESVDFCMPLFNITHLCGAAITINMSAVIVYFLTKGTVPSFAMFVPFILLEGVVEVAAAGIPGGSITAALGILQTFLGFDPTALGMMIALFMMNDSFCTATCVMGDAALTMIVNKAVVEADVAGARSEVAAD